MPTAEILSQGDEVVNGQIADTNAAWLSTRLGELGFDVVRHTAVGDRLADLISVFAEVCARADVVICTGGLGPTDDDLTAEAVAQAFQAPLALDEVALADILSMYARYQRRMPEVNRKQALMPARSRRLDNAWGTAPGFALDTSRALLVCMPGVPREMKPMFDARVQPVLAERFGVSPSHLVTLRTTGVGESDLQERIGTPAEPDYIVSYRTMLPENHIKLRFAAGTSAERIASVSADIAARIGSPLFSFSGLPSGVLAGPDPVGGDLAETVGRALAAQGATLAVAESCTGGRIASACTGIPGASTWFLEGVVTYANASKQRLLGVSASDLDAHGAVSEPVARQMALGVREACQSTYGLSTTGIAGPGGGSEAKPVGTVHLALSGPHGVTHRVIHVGGDRQRIQALAAGAALDLLRRQLQGLSA